MELLLANYRPHPKNEGGGQGVTQSPSHNAFTGPMSFLGGTPVTGPRSLPRQGGTPVPGGGVPQSQVRGTPVLGYPWPELGYPQPVLGVTPVSDEGTPIPDRGIPQFQAGVPSQDWGTTRTRLGYPPPPSGDRTVE